MVLKTESVSCFVVSDSLLPHQALLSMEFSRQEYWTFLTQGSNPGLLHCRQILCSLSHQGSPKNTGVVSYSLLQKILPTKGSKLGLLHCRQILYPLSHQGAAYHH